MEDEFVKELINNGLYKFNGKEKITIPTTRFPTNLNIKNYNKLFNIQKQINLIFEKALSDPKNFDNLPNTPIYNIFTEIKKRKKNNCNINFIYLRSDYIIDEYMCPKLVEYNAQSISLGFFGPALNKLHKKNNKNVCISESDKDFINAVKQIYSYFPEGSIALMIDEQINNNVSNYTEKQMIINELIRHDIQMIHVSMLNIEQKANFNGKEMFYENKKVFLAYYRWFYNDSHYNTQHINTRIKIESTDVVSLPTVELQILGLKYFQTVLPNTIQQYDSDYEKILETFVEYKKIEDFKKGDEKHFVLKTFNEGGNSNFFDDEIPIQIDKGFKEGFLMRKIGGFLFKNIINGIETNVVLEIGVFGILISVKNNILQNHSSGYIVRTKNSKSNECGVSCGNGFLDSILE